MLELTIEAKVNNRKFEFTFNQLKELLSVVNDMIYGRAIKKVEEEYKKLLREAVKECNSTTIEFEKGYRRGYERAENERGYEEGYRQAEKDFRE